MAELTARAGAAASTITLPSIVDARPRLQRTNTSTHHDDHRATIQDARRQGVPRSSRTPSPGRPGPTPTARGRTALRYGTARWGCHAEEIERRSNVLGILPNGADAAHLVGAVLADQHDEWAVARRYASQAPVATLDACLSPSSSHPAD